MSNQDDMHCWRIAVVEDHALQRRHTEQLLNAEQDFHVVFSGESTSDMLRWIRSVDRTEWPQLLVLDLMIERQPSVDVRLVKSLVDAGLRIVVLSALASPPLVRGVIRAGVNGVIGKRDTEATILEAIRAVLAGEEWMTTELASVIAGDPDRPKLSIQEENALVLYASGLTLSEVAFSMNVKPDTAKQYLDRVKSKYNSAGVEAKSKVDLSRIAWMDGYLDPRSPRAQSEL